MYVKNNIYSFLQVITYRDAERIDPFYCWYCATTSILAAEAPRLKTWISYSTRNERNPWIKDYMYNNIHRLYMIHQESSDEPQSLISIGFLGLLQQSTLALLYARLSWL